MAITWNPADKDPGLILSNGDLTANGNDGDYCAVRATESKSSGKRYWETTLDGSQLNYHFFGIGTSAENLDQYPGYTAAGYSIRFSTGGARYKFHNGSQGSYGTGGSLGDVIGHALDLDNGKFWISINGVWIGSPVAGTDPAFTGIAGTFFPMIGLYGNAGDNLITAKFTSGDQTYSPPSGFISYDTGILNLLDGKVCISPKTLLLDGKVSINTPIDLFDGKVVVKDAATDLFDGKARVKDVTTNLLDGKAIVKDTTTNLLDGKVHPVLSVTHVFDGKATLHPVVDGDIELPLFEIEAASGINATFNEQLLLFEVEAFTGGVGDIELPFFDLEAEAHTGSIASASAKLPMLDLTALTGAKGSFSLPLLECDSDATVGMIASSDIELPMIQLDASALMNIIAGLEASLPRLNVSASSKCGIVATGDVTLYPLHLVAEGVAGRLAIGSLELPSLVVEAELSHVPTGDGDMELPSLSLLAKSITLFDPSEGCTVLRYDRWR